MSTFSQKCMQEIEQILFERIQLKTVARRMGYSPSHFHRKFIAEFKLSLVEYVRKRRLAYASSLLIHTKVRIIEIALSVGFESQESFTRAFQKGYGLPPGRYRSLLKELKEGDQTMDVTPIKGWMLAGDKPQHYEVGLDTKVVHQGKQSAYIKGIMEKPIGGFVTLMQQFKADKYVGKRMKLSGFVKTNGIQEYCGLWMRVDNKQQDVLQFDNMYNRKIVGDTDWNIYSIVLDIPEESDLIAFGLNVSGPGQVWLDSLIFQEVKKTVPTTNVDWQFEMDDAPQNLTFDD
ncbi:MULTISPECIES: helix-turn-helix domain-containing protein [Shouchella]|uniref:AraC family transcriptional regulator n=2 Tax=Shouchella TaxID=2893057 RepID=A0ABY7WE85_9BACI|nr:MULTISPECIES: AraC family transcriptional regulator [Shouchella]MED4128168.1 AraC family transcriptional regulator [Shouchella miscanthi]WDF04980.1 AraC family transcriptional regulator [Shouchella hunanensis]GAF21142.1 transcriptional regulator, AraC family [Bacillus sp. JCM 19047]